MPIMIHDTHTALWFLVSFIIEWIRINRAKPRVSQLMRIPHCFTCRTRVENGSSKNLPLSRRRAKKKKDFRYFSYVKHSSVE